MKKELKNVLIRKRKKNGIFIWICAVVLTISLGMLTGCSAAKEDPEKGSIGNEDASDGDMENVPEQSEPEEAQMELMPADDSAADNNGKTNDNVETGEYLEAEDCQKIRTVLDAFAEAYFDGDADAIRKFLADTYEGEIDLYEGTGVISDLTVKGLSDVDEKKMENGKYNVSIEFRDSTYEDMFLYLTVIVVKEEDDWKIQFYGVEG